MGEKLLCSEKYGSRTSLTSLTKWIRNEMEQYLLSLGWKPTHNSKGELTLVRFSNPRIGFKPASGTLIIGYHEYPHRITSIEQLLSTIDQ